jgi:hypothetical protein
LISRIDERSGRFQLAASAGAPLLEPGTSLPVATCSYFAATAEGRALREADLDHARDFTLPLDGGRARLALPLRRRPPDLLVVGLRPAAEGGSIRGPRNVGR